MLYIPFLFAPLVQSEPLGIPAIVLEHEVDDERLRSLKRLFMASKISCGRSGKWFVDPIRSGLAGRGASTSALRR